MESFEIKDLYSLQGKPGLYLFKGAVKGGHVFTRLTEPGKTIVFRENVTKISDVGVYVGTDKEETVLLETVFERMYELTDKGIIIPDSLIHINDRWNDVSDFMEEIVPNYNKTEFKPYHMEKILKWYSEMVKALDMLTTEVVDADEE